MKFMNWLERGTVNRSLLVGGIIMGLLVPYNIIVDLRYPALDGLLLDALSAAVAAGVAWWAVFCGPSRRLKDIRRSGRTRSEFSDRRDD